MEVIGRQRDRLLGCLKGRKFQCCRLERHADHHMHGSRPFQLLRNLPDAPQLPFSCECSCWGCWLLGQAVQLLDVVSVSAAAGGAGCCVSQCNCSCCELLPKGSAWSSDLVQQQH